MGDTTLRKTDKIMAEKLISSKERDYLGQLSITTKMVAKKIRDMKDNKSPGVDGIPPKLILKIVE